MLLNHYTIDTTSGLLLGKSLNAVHEDASAEALEIEYLFDVVNKGCLHRLLIGPLMFLYRDRDFICSMGLIKTFFDKIYE